MGAWFGSKATTGLSQAIVSLTPPHGAYLETHLGGGAIMKRKPPALRNIGIDLNRRAIDTFSCDYPVETPSRLRPTRSCPTSTSRVTNWSTATRPTCSRRAGRSAATASTTRTPTMSRFSAS